MKEKLLFKKLFFVLLVGMWIQMIPQSFALAQVPFPKRPVNVSVMFAAGGFADTIARIIAEKAEETLGQKIVVVNKPGGGGTVGTTLLANEKPDGYTIGISSDSAITRSPHLYDLKYDPMQDFTFIVRIGIAKSCFAVKADGPFKTWDDVVKWAKDNPGQLVFGHFGKGSAPHFAMITAAKKEGFTFKDVPFRGGVRAVTALLGGHVMVAATTPGGVRSHVEAKTARIILTIAKERISNVPEHPIFEEKYIELPDSFFMFYGPKGIPDRTRKILEKALIDGIKGEKFQEYAKKCDIFMAEPITGKALHDYAKKNYILYEKLLKEAGLYKKGK